MSKYDWTNVPYWANWIATDRNGEITYFESKPYINMRYWLPSSGRSEGFFIDEHDCPCWRDSLEERPK